MRRTFALKASANSAGYCVALKINGREFVANALVGDTVHDVYGRFAAELQDVYGELYKSTGNTKIFYARKIKCLRLSVRCTDL